MAIYGIATDRYEGVNPNIRAPGDLNGHLRDCDSHHRGATIVVDHARRPEWPSTGLRPTRDAIDLENLGTPET